MTNDATAKPQPAPLLGLGSSAVLGAGANISVRDPYNLDFVLMPLVRMLAEHQLSWSNREQIAHAMIATVAHHKSMTDEMQMHAQGAASGFAQQARQQGA